MIELCFVLDLVLNSHHNPTCMYHRPAFLPSCPFRNVESFNRHILGEMSAFCFLTTPDQPLIIVDGRSRCAAVISLDGLHYPSISPSNNNQCFR